MFVRPVRKGKTVTNAGLIYFHLLLEELAEGGYLQ
jgi:hypothetical protein